MQATDNPEIQKFIKMFKTAQQKQLFELMCKEPGADIDRIIQAFWYALAHRNLNKHYGL